MRSACSPRCVTTFKSWNWSGLFQINELGVAADRVPLFPYFQGKEQQKHPQWSLDLDALPAPYNGHPLRRRPDEPL